MPHPSESATMKGSPRSSARHRRRRGGGPLRLILQPLLYILSPNKVGVLLILIILGAAGFFLSTAGISWNKPWVSISKGIGFRLKSVTIEGRSNLPKEQILNSLGVTPNQPLFDMDLNAMKTQLESQPRIKTAVISRHLPYSLNVWIEERQAIARILVDNQMHLVDIEGKVLSAIDEGSFDELPLINGEGAAAHVVEINNILKTEPDLYRHVTSMSFVGERRWNLLMDNHLEIKLPEDNTLQAWQYLKKIDKDYKLLHGNIREVDLRLPDRLIIRQNDNKTPIVNSTSS